MVSDSDGSPPREPVTFTVAIPTHNSRETLLMAVRSALAQTRPPVEVIVVADGCTDGTVEALQALGDDRVVPLDLPKGPGFGYSNRNEALRRARGTVVAWLSHDDLYLPDHLERIGALYDGLGADLVQAASCRVRSDGSLNGRLRNDWRVPEFREMYLGDGLGTASSTVSHITDLGLQVGGWRDVARQGDRDLFTRIVRAGARTALSPMPTVLVFRAKSLPREDQVALNAAFLGRLEEPRELARLQAEMTAAIEQRTADLLLAEEKARARARRAKRKRRRAEAKLREQRAKLRALRPQRGGPRAGGLSRLRTWPARRPRAGRRPGSG